MKQTIHAWKTLSLVEQDVTLPSGQRIKHTTINHPGAAVIIPVTSDHNIIMVRQFRPTLNDWVLELPAGTLEAGESPMACATRELEEETGYSAETFISLGHIMPLISYCNEIQHIFVAKQLKFTNRLTCDDDEIIETIALSPAELKQRIITNTIYDSKTLACLSKAQLCGYL